MKASDMISQLQRLISEHGDLPVFVWPYDGQMWVCESEGISYENDLKDCAPGFVVGD